MNNIAVGLTLHEETWDPDVPIWAGPTFVPLQRVRNVRVVGQERVFAVPATGEESLRANRRAFEVRGDVRELVYPQASASGPADIDQFTHSRIRRRHTRS
jgi:hypothetical protein